MSEQGEHRAMSRPEWSLFASPRFTRGAFMLGSMGALASLAGLRGLLPLEAARAATPADCDFVHWQVRLALTAASLKEENDALEAAGYRPVSLSGYEADGGVRYAGLFERRAASRLELHLANSAANFRDTDVGLRIDGYRLLAIDGFAVANTALYNGIWERASGPDRTSDLGLTAPAFRNRFAERKAASYRPVDISGFELRDRARFAVVWEQGKLPEYNAKVDLTTSEFSDLDARMKADGYRLVDVSVYVVRGITRVAAIWNRDSAEDYVRLGDGEADFGTQTEALRYRGYRPTALDGYDAGGTDLYASLWRNHGIAQAVERTMDDTIRFFMQDHDVPGLSMAFAKDGRLVYARAFGVARKADAATGEPAEPLTVQHRFRIGSTSKSITAIAIQKLIQDGLLTGSDFVFGADGILGTKYGSPDLQYPTYVLQVRVRHLLNHTAGPGPLAQNDQGKWESRGGWANAGTRLLWDPADKTRKELIDYVLDGAAVPGGTYELTLPPGSVYAYSGFGYLLLGRIIETVTGLPYETYVRESILGPASTMRIALDTRELKRPNEVEYYSQAPDGDPYGLRIERADSSGGWMASAIDLVRVMTTVDGVGGDLVTEDNRLRMLTHPKPEPAALYPPDGVEGYGRGWYLQDFDEEGVPQTYFHGGSIYGTHSIMARTLGEDRSVYCWGAVINTRHQPDTDVEDPPPPPWIRPAPTEYGTSDLNNPMRDWFGLVKSWPCFDLF